MSLDTPQKQQNVVPHASTVFPVIWLQHGGSGWLLSKYLNWIASIYLFLSVLNCWGTMSGDDDLVLGNHTGRECWGGKEGTDLGFYLSSCVWVLCLPVCCSPGTRVKDSCKLLCRY